MPKGNVTKMMDPLITLGAPVTAISEPLRTAFGTLSPTFQPKDLTTGRLQAILDGLEDAVLLVDALEQPLYVNEAVFDLLGFNPARETLEIWAAQCGAQRPGCDGPYPWADFPLSRVLRGESGHPIEIYLDHPRVAPVTWLRVSARPLKGSGQHVAGAIVVLRDITARKRYETDLQNSRNCFEAQANQLTATLTELKAAQSQLIQTEKMSSLGQVVAGVAHEINNPIGFIHGNLVHVDAYVQDLLGLMDAYQQHLPEVPDAIAPYLEVMDLPFMREDLPKLVASMRMGTARIKDIVLSLRNFSRLDEAAVKTVDLHEGLNSTLTLLGNRLRAKADQRSIELVKAYGSLPPVACYAGQLNQVFMSILTNAIDALAVQRRSPADSAPTDAINAPPTITLRTEATGGDWVRIEISNNGPEIEEAVRQRIFDPFFTTKAVGKGQGMGLAISYQIVVDQHGGSLKCLSSAEGTTFRIDIPVQQMGG
ncbi:MAG: PAS domain-containing sensor histidine kinase [Leptolyngbya sp. RL_3_1]|nr:PAS domain-containing sensor histidine kinase [Leptolyngbya sp. RL_3_1]